MCVWGGGEGRQVDGKYSVKAEETEDTKTEGTLTSRVIPAIPLERSVITQPALHLASSSQTYLHMRQPDPVSRSVVNKNGCPNYSCQSTMVRALWL